MTAGARRREGSKGPGQQTVVITGKQQTAWEQDIMLRRSPAGNNRQARPGRREHGQVVDVTGVAPGIVWQAKMAAQCFWQKEFARLRGRHVSLVEPGHNEGWGIVKRQFEPSQQLDSRLLEARRDRHVLQVLQDQAERNRSGDARRQGREHLQVLVRCLLQVLARHQNGALGFIVAVQWRVAVDLQDEIQDGSSPLVWMTSRALHGGKEAFKSDARRLELLP